MIKLIDSKVYLLGGSEVLDSKNISDFEVLAAAQKYGNFDAKDVAEARDKTISAGILRAHNKGTDSEYRLKFDALTSHDITYVGVVQTAKGSGLGKFPLPYVLTNCHNSLCAVGGTINEDDHIFGLSAAKKYGGIYVPAHIAVIHQYMREMMASCGSMILGSDSHTRYGALGTMAIGEGGPEIVKQLLEKTYDISAPKVTLVYLKGKVRKGVGPQDVALSIIGAVFKNGFVKNRVMEFAGEGISDLSVDFRNGVDVMTTETTCLSSIWATDEKVRGFYRMHGREEGYKKLSPGSIAAYDNAVIVDLDKVEPVMAMPFHPSNVYKLSDVIANPMDVLDEVEKNAYSSDKIKVSLKDKVIGGKLTVQQGIIAGCAGGLFENIQEATAILKRGIVGSEQFNLSVYPSSQPIYIELVKNGTIAQLMQQGAVVKTAFCGPCFGAGDVPGNNTLSIRHTTRNFPNREGSKPGDKQIASVALMDARSIAATAANGGVLTSALGLDYDSPDFSYSFDKQVYDSRVYYGFGKADNDYALKYGPNIADWPKMIPLTENVLMRFATVIKDPVTTTDELIPSGETSSYRSNPLRLAEFTLSRKDPAYVGRAKDIKAEEDKRQAGDGISADFERALTAAGAKTSDTLIASVIYAVKPGDGSAREQAASCQRVLGAIANVAREYATKRYRSNLINWGMLPLLCDYEDFRTGDFLYIQGIKDIVANGIQSFKGKLIREGEKALELNLSMESLTADERKIILEGCLMNFYSAANAK